MENDEVVELLRVRGHNRIWQWIGTIGEGLRCVVKRGTSVRLTNLIQVNNLGRAPTPTYKYFKKYKRT